MQLRNTADFRTVLTVALAGALVVLQYAWPQTILFVLPFSWYLGIACGVIAHNHNHCPTFKGRRANHAFGHALTLFYGYPTLMWIPTHNMNHHRMLNRPGDATITWRYSNKQTLLVALSYFFVSSYFQSEPIQRYIRRAKARNQNLYARIIFQYAVWIGYLVLSLALAIALHHKSHLGLGFVVWFAAVFFPAVSSLFFIMFFNYIQHVHADAWSDHDHSRNFTGKIFNFLFFNNGYHTVHHDHPGVHWSLLPAAHAKLAPLIDPRLCEGNLVWYLIRQYLLAPLFPQLGTQQIGPEPRNGPAGAPAELLDPKLEAIQIEAAKIDELGCESAPAEPAACTIG